MERFVVTGMSCAACSARVEKAVSAVPGVSACSVNLLTHSMGVEGCAAPEAVIAAVEAAGYGARRQANDGGGAAAAAGRGDDAPLATDREAASLRRRLLWSFLFLAPLMYMSMGHMMWDWPLPSLFKDNHVAMGLAQLLLAAAVMAVNQGFFVSGAKSVLNGSPNMDTLVAMGASVSFGWSVYVLFAMTRAQTDGNADSVLAYMHEFYFESAAMILTLITVGKMLEARSRGRTTDALKALLRMAPQKAALIRDGREVEVGIEAVRVGDVFVVKPGEKLPVDGQVVEGESAVDEAALTGESIPVDKAAGDFVSAGTVNQSGFLRCRATRVGRDTTLSQIVQMVSDAAATKAPIAKIADRVSGVFVPAVIAIAALTTACWLLAGESAAFALARGIAVLVISCPCALGLATPVAIMVGNGVGARRGILFKTAESLEHAGKTQIVALDKTGTITGGLPEVTDIFPAEGVTEEELLAVAHALESRSEHPLARAIVARADKAGMRAAAVEKFQAFPGNGLVAVQGNVELAGGKSAFVGDRADVPVSFSARANKLSEAGKTPLYFSRGGRFLGVIAVADVIREDSALAVRELREMGVRVIMLTGDNERTAAAVGAQAGVDEIVANILPGGKERVVRDLKAQGRVAMVGDGVNDAPALTCADVGIAIGAGADVAIDAADVVLMRNALSDVPAAIRLSRATLGNIRENLFWAFCYNIVGIPLAAGCFYGLSGWKLNPMFCAAAMSLSSFCVVTNALRLNLFNPHGGVQNEKSPQQKDREKPAMEKILTVRGMMCPHCEAHVKQAVESVDGVISATASHKDGTVVVMQNGDVSVDALARAVVGAGYEFVGVR